MSVPAPLTGLTAVLFENRLSKVLADLVRLRGATPFSAPALKEVPLEENSEALKFGDKLAAGEVDALILLTGVGTRALFDAIAAQRGRDAVKGALLRVPIVPRGPKPTRVLAEWGLPAALTVPEPNTWRELIAALDDNAARVPLSGRRVAVQEYGEPLPELTAELERRGAKVWTVPVYRWTLPDDLEPLREGMRLLISGKAQIAMFTTSVQVDHLFRVAEREGSAGALKAALSRAVVASVGPDCSRSLRARGIEPDVEPVSPKMGPLVADTAERAPAILKKKRGPA